MVEEVCNFNGVDNKLGEEAYNITLQAIQDQDMADRLFSDATALQPTADGITLQQILSSYAGPVRILNVPLAAAGPLNDYMLSQVNGKGGYSARLREKGLYDRMGLSLRRSDRNDGGAVRSWGARRAERASEPAAQPNPTQHTFVMATRQFGPVYGPVSQHYFVRPQQSKLEL